MIRVFPTEVVAPVRALHGVSLGPIDRRWGLDLSESYRAVGIPSVRTHDAPIQMNDVVDLHCLFPNPKADPDDPDNYVFGPTDDYLAAIHAVGADIYLRFGESIEHQPTKRYVKAGLWTPETMAKVAVNVARHYNEGWADGHEWNIRYWEFWCEPENGYRRPENGRPLWEGSVDEFYECYRAVASALKAHDGDLRVGLAGFTGGFVQPWLDAAVDDASAVDGWASVLLRSIDAEVPIDFLSWHNYRAGWDPIIQTAARVRDRLDALGLSSAEQHLTEWGYNPTLVDDDGEFTFMMARRSASYDRYDHAMRVGNGPAGAAFNFGMLASMQDTTIDLAHHYTGVSQPFGLFEPSGRPHPKFAAFEAFAEFVQDHVGRLRVDVDPSQSTQVAALAGARPDGSLLIGVANLDPDLESIEIDISGGVDQATMSADYQITCARSVGDRGWREAGLSSLGGALRADFDGPGLCLLHLTPVRT